MINELTQYYLNNKKSRKIVNTLLALFIVLIFVQTLLPLSFLSVQAATLKSASLTITDSRASQTGVGYTFGFITPSTTAIKTVALQICTTASGACSLPSSFSTASMGGVPVVTGITGTGFSATFATDTITVTVNSPASQTAGGTVSIPITGIGNPSATGSFFVRITTKDAGAVAIDTATVASAILASTAVQVTANVDPTFTFSIAPVASGSVVNAATTTIGTTATAVTFGTLTVGTAAIGAHDLSVTTNAVNGYSITLKATTNPTMADGANSFTDFTGTNASPTTWSAPAGSSPNSSTAYFGYTTESTTLTGTAARFQTNKWAGPTTSALQVANATAGTGAAQTTRVGYQVQVNALQPQGSYAGTLVLVATPTY